MAATADDLTNRIIQSQGKMSEDIFREAIKAAEQFNDNVVQFKEAYGTTVDDDDDQWRKLTGNSNRDLSPMTQERMIKLALYLWESNLLANRIIELPVAFMLAEGVNVVADDEVVQEWIDKFWKDPINEMDIKLVKKVRELSLFGEQCWPAFVNEHNGHVRLGYLDPSMIATIVTDPQNPEQPIGVVTVKNTKGIARRYKIILNGSEEELFTQRTIEIRETFTDGQCFYFNINSLSNGTRGRSDLLPQIDWLDSYEQFLFGELDRTQFLRAFIWDVELKNATPEEVKERAKTIRNPSPGSVRVHNDSEIWKTVSPELNSEDTSESAGLFRKHIQGGASQPEHWFGGGGDVNRATALEMNEPTFKMMTMRQTYIGYILKYVITFVIRQKELANSNHEPDIHDEIYNFNVQFPEMVSRDLGKYATALTQVTMAVAQLVSNSLITRERGLQIVEKITSRLGVDFDVPQELDDAIEEAKKNKADDVFTTNDGEDDE